MRRASRAQAMVFFAILLPAVLVPAAAYGAEATLIATRQARLQETAALVALDAAQRLDVSRLRSDGVVAADPAAQAAAVRAAVAARAPLASVDELSSTSAGVRLVLSERVPLHLASFVPGAAVTIHAAAAARLRTGYAAPG